MTLEAARLALAAQEDHRRPRKIVPLAVYRERRQQRLAASQPEVVADCGHCGGRGVPIELTARTMILCTRCGRVLLEVVE